MAVDSLTINPIRISTRLAVVALCLAAASYGLQVFKFQTGHEHVLGLVDLLDVDGEQNIPTIYSVFLMLTTAGLLSFIAFLTSRSRERDLSRWVMLAAGFAWMAIDEAWLMHERLIDPMRKLVGGNPDQLGVLHFTWVLPAIGFVLVLGIFFLGFLWRLPVSSRIRFIVAGAIYLSGAVGFELIGGAYAETHGEANPGYKMLTTIEESLEMAGVIIFIDALLRYLCTRFPQVTTRFRENPADSTILNVPPSVQSEASVAAAPNAAVHATVVRQLDPAS